MSEFRVEDILRRFGALRSVRDGQFLKTWRETRQYVYPNYRDDLTAGGSRGVELYDTTAVDARQRLAAGMYAWMAPPDKKWFELLPKNEKLAQKESLKSFFAEVTNVLSVSMANSNWPGVLIELLNDLACGLDAIVYCEDGGSEEPFSFRRIPVETACYCEDKYGNVDTVFHEVVYTSRQLLDAFGDAVPEKIRNEAADPAKCDTPHTVLHAVLPRYQVDENAEDNLNMPFADLFIDIDNRVLLRESGFMEMPIAVCRFEKSPNEPYGRGPGVNKLPDIKMLCRIRQSLILGVEHQADPSYLVPDGSIVSGNFNKNPGSVITYRTDLAMGNAKPEQLPYNFNAALVMNCIAEERQNIKNGFFWDIFDPLGDLKSITATEAQIRNDGKLVPFAPVAANLHNELFRVVIHRAFGICLRRGLFPDMPPEVAENPDYKVEFVSKIARSLKKQEPLAWIQTAASLESVFAAAPETADIVDFDLVARDLLSASGGNPKWERSTSQVQDIRAARSQAQAQSQAITAISQGASVLGSNLGKAPEPGSPLASVLDMGTV